MANSSEGVSRPPFMVCRDFIETPFEKRFQAASRYLWETRSWQVISAVPGSGKSIGIDDLVYNSGAYKSVTGKTYFPVLAVRAPKNDKMDRSLGLALSSAFGLVPSMSWEERKIRLVQMMASTQVECILIDDAHDLNRFHLGLLKELTDNLAAFPYRRQIGLGLIAAHTGDVVPLKDIITQPETTWKQFYRRMDTEHPFNAIDGHTLEEVRKILGAFEDLYRDQMPDLRLRRWAKSIFTWLIDPNFDLDSTKRVTMNHLTRLVTSALRRAYDRGEADVTGAILEETANLMIYRRDELFHIDHETNDLLPDNEHDEPPSMRDIG